MRAGGFDSVAIPAAALAPPERSDRRAAMKAKVGEFAEATPAQLSEFAASAQAAAGPAVARLANSVVDAGASLSSEVDSIADIQAQLKSNGYDLSWGPGLTPNGKTKMAFVDDPDGFEIELLEYGKK